MTNKPEGAVEIYFDRLGHPHKVLFPSETRTGWAFTDDVLKKHEEKIRREAFEAGKAKVKNNRGNSCVKYRKFADYLKEAQSE